MKIGIANDHTGIEMKQEITNYLESMGHEVVNYGTDEHQSRDARNEQHAVSDFHWQIPEYAVLDGYRHRETDARGTAVSDDPGDPDHGAAHDSGDK